MCVVLMSITTLCSLSNAWSQSTKTKQRLNQNKETKTPINTDIYHVDEKGRKLRIKFPLYDRVSFGTDVQTTSLLDGFGLTRPSWRFAWDVSVAKNFTDENIWWNMRHRVLDTSATWDWENDTGALTLDILKGSYLRHDLSSFITIPTLNDLRVPANFDIAVTYTAGRMFWQYDKPNGMALTRIEFMDLALLLDFVRDEDYRHRFAVGLSGWYYADTKQETWKHEVAPLSGLKVLYGWDHARGLFSFLAQGQCGLANHFTSDQDNQSWLWRCRASTQMRWIPFSISDRPITIPFEMNLDAPMGQGIRPELTATLGIQFGFNMD